MTYSVERRRTPHGDQDVLVGEGFDRVATAAEVEFWQRLQAVEELCQQLGVDPAGDWAAQIAERLKRAEARIGWLKLTDAALFAIDRRVLSKGPSCR